MAEDIMTNVRLISEDGEEIKNLDKWFAKKANKSVQLYYQFGENGKNRIEVPIEGRTKKRISHVLTVANGVKETGVKMKGDADTVKKAISRLCGAIYEYELVVALEKKWYIKAGETKEQKGRVEGVETKISSLLNSLKNTGRIVTTKNGNVYNIKIDPEGQKMIYNAANEAAERYLKKWPPKLKIEKIESAGRGGNDLGDVKILLNDGTPIYVEAKWSPRWKTDPDNKIWWWRPSISIFNSDFKEYLAYQERPEWREPKEYQKYMSERLTNLTESDFFKEFGKGKENTASSWLLYLLSKGKSLKHDMKKSFKNDKDIAKDVLVGYELSGSRGKVSFIFNSGKLMDKIYKDVKSNSNEIGIEYVSKFPPRVNFKGSDRLIGSFQLGGKMYSSLLKIGKEKTPKEDIEIDGTYEFVLYTSYLASKFKQ